MDNIIFIGMPSAGKSTIGVVAAKRMGYEFVDTDRDKLKQESEANRSKGVAMAEEICRKYRRKGRFFDEILEAGE